MKIKQSIEIRIHYPKTKEGLDIIKKSQASIMIEILEKQLGEKKVEELFQYIKKKMQKGLDE